jgi:predicted GNAT family N-acyltransferase
MRRPSIFIRSTHCRPEQTDRTLEDSRAIQQAVFIEEQGIDPSNVFNDVYQAVHYVFYIRVNHKEIAVACARAIRMSPQRSIKIGRVATLKKFRGNKYATRLLEYLIEEQGRTFNPPFFFLNSQLDAQGLYSSLGFKPSGETFNEAGIRHIRMELDWSRNITVA